jgi:hypothetical protein
MRHLFLVSVLFCGCCSESLCTFKNEDVTNMYSSYVEEWQTQAKQAFEEAEPQVFKVAPKPDDGTNPDAAKCICKGTGIIVQGDGHKTVCPYHGVRALQSQRK